jgi:hypothetical protein
VRAGLRGRGGVRAAERHDAVTPDPAGRRCPDGTMRSVRGRLDIGDRPGEFDQGGYALAAESGGVAIGAGPHAVEVDRPGDQAEASTPWPDASEGGEAAVEGGGREPAVDHPAAVGQADGVGGPGQWVRGLRATAIRASYPQRGGGPAAFRPRHDDGRMRFRPCGEADSRAPPPVRGEPPGRV